MSKGGLLKNLTLTLGFSHLINYAIPDGITIETPDALKAKGILTAHVDAALTKEQLCTLQAEDVLASRVFNQGI